MDFKKIARIFIVAFGLLNIYLIIGIFNRTDIQDTSSQPADENLISNMEASDIELPDLSETEASTEEVYSLQINAHNLLSNEIENSDNLTGTLDDEGVYYDSFPSNPIQLEGTPADGFTESDVETVRDFVLSENVMFGEEYTFHRYDQAGNRFVFYQFVDGLPIADGTSEISLFVNDTGEIYAYQQTYAGPVSRQGNPLELINGLRAIETLFLNNEIRQGSEVQPPTLTYRRALYLEDLSMYSPVWIVNIDHSSERNTFRVDAVNGTIIRQPVAPPNEEEEATDEETEESNEETPTDSNSQ
jgi:regulatory protein YycI of two-component signal transduction system YycFG